MTFSQLFNNINNGSSLSQNASTDSIKKKPITTDDRIKIISFTLVDTVEKSLDTSISFLHRNPIINKWQVDLGNFGSSNKSLLFSPTMAANIQFGIESNTSYLFTHESKPFFNTTRPYTDLYYRLGTKQEQMIELLHTQNI